jgi:hypothetical protein
MVVMVPVGFFVRQNVSSGPLLLGFLAAGPFLEAAGGFHRSHRGPYGAAIAISYALWGEPFFIGCFIC